MINTFWKLINRSEIEIPIIQRDYVQGRIDERIDEIREKLIRDLIYYLLENNEKPLNLDFVYGKSIEKNSIEAKERNKENVERILQTIKEYSKTVGYDFVSNIKEITTNEQCDKLLIPLDGQQRLTTLFLLHFYIGVRLNKDISVLLRFKYKTRKSSASFCNALISHAKEFSNVNTDISDFIEDQKWYFLSWKKDPTVAGMLVMLNQIQKELVGKDDDELTLIWENLTTDNKITFDFFDLNKEGLEDELYVKMNARGKSLTDFENFKAWLQKNAKINDYKLLANWENNIDKDWLDIFWNMRKNTDSIDNNFLNFFKHLSLFKKINLFRLFDDSLIENDKILLQKLSSENFVSTSYYEKENLFDQNTLTYIFTILQNLSKKEDLEKIDNLTNKYWVKPFSENRFSEALFLNFKKLSLSHKTFIYSVLSFIINLDKKPSDYTEIEDKNLEEWIRISRNLIYNSRIDDDVPYVKAIQAINLLEKNILNIRAYLKDSVGDNGKNGKWVSYFPKNQQEEEWIKGTKLQDNWTASLIRAENHFYFYGQIQFILNLSKDVNNDYNLDSFNSYLDKLERLFTEQNLDNRYIVQRVLVATLNENARWMKFLSSDRWSFYSSLRTNSRQRDENWRELFKDDPEKLGGLKTLLDLTDCTQDSLNDIIKKGKSTITDWRFFFIENPNLFEVCSQSLINWQDGNYIRLLGESRLSHYHMELRSYALFKSLQEKYKWSKENYIQVRSGSEVPYISFTSGNIEYYIQFFSNEKCFKYKTAESLNYINLDKSLPIYDEVSKFKTYC